MKRINYLIIGILVSMYFLSCYEDKGHYDYLDYNKIKKVESKGSKSIVLGDTIKIQPVITWKYPDRDTLAFDYQWELNDAIISKDRNLVYVPNRTTAGSTCALYITERATGIVTSYSTSISVSTAFKKGWTILSENAGKSVLSYIRRDEKEDINGKKYYQYVAYKDIYNTFFQGINLGSEPKRLFYLQGGAKDEILVMQKPNECVYLSGQDFSKSIYLTDEFTDKKYPTGFTPKEFVDAVACNFLVGENGQVYWRVVSPGSHEVSYIPVPLYQPGGLNIAFFPSIRLYGMYVVYMYDKLHNRMFVRSTMPDRSCGANMEIINNTKPENVADIKDFKNYKLIYMGGDDPNYLMILKDINTGGYVYHSFRATDTYSLSVMISRHFQEPFAGSSLISDNTVFFSLRKMNYLFFGEGSKLYFYDKNTKRVKLYHDFGSGNIVKMAPNANESEIGVALDNGNVYVCSTNITILATENPGKEGGILHQTTGLGKVVDMIWKYGGSYPIII